MSKVNKKICDDKNCSNEFTPFNTIQKYCSHQCKTKNKKPNLKLKPLYAPPKPKKCLECGEKFVPKNISTEKVCSNYDCRVKYALKIVEKNKVSNKKLEKRKRADEKNLLKEKLRGIPELKKELEKEINKICCLIDKGSTCISCNGSTTPQAGHYHSVGSNGSLRYNLDNLHLQDYNCNCAKGGNIHKYDLGLIELYGKEYWEYVKFDIVSKFPVLKMAIFDYKEKIVLARQVVKHLKLENKTYPALKRLELRKEYNDFLGIYK